jgi:RimJ/RimL family protein N-acetyltransferase
MRRVSALPRLGGPMSGYREPMAERLVTERLVLHPQAWGRGYATESGLALARWAFSQDIDQVIALVRPANTRAVATVRRIGMEWVGETEKYHGLRLQEFRLGPADLAGTASG